MKSLVSLYLAIALACTSTPPPTDPRPTLDVDAASAMNDAATIDAAAPGTCAVDTRCDGKTGLCAPTAQCSTASPCVDAQVGTTRQTVTSALTPPVCKTANAARPSFDDGAPRTWTAAGIERAACLYSPPGANLPLVIYLHGATGAASAIYDATSLRQKAPTFNLSDDPARLGFVLASDQGRNMRSDNGNPAGARRDLYYRMYDQHADVAALDELIDGLVVEKNIDRTRIYLTGWSNGGFFAQAYGLLRHEQPTAGGNKVAAVAVFDAGNPFLEGVEGEAACAYQLLPKSTLPVFVVHRACSIVACNATQRIAVGSPPGFDVTSWIADLKAKVGATDVTELTLGATGQPSTCANACGRAIAIQQHVRWPDGVLDGSGMDYEPTMLNYLKAHPLP
jgi:poly(3-hydroxybutyrate) depolymerase